MFATFNLYTFYRNHKRKHLIELLVFINNSKFKYTILVWNICFRACAYFSMDVLCSSLFGHHVTSHKNPGEDFVKKVLEAFEAGNKTIIKPVTLCGKIFFYRN